MKTNNFLEKKVWAMTYENRLGAADVTKLTDYLLESLSIFLKNPVEKGKKSGQTEVSFMADFRARVVSDDFFHIFNGEPPELNKRLNESMTLTFGGTVAAQVIDEEYGVITYADIHIFLNHQRFAPPDKDYIYLRYHRGEDETSYWESGGWVSEEFEGEYSAVQEDRFF